MPEFSHAKGVSTDRCVRLGGVILDTRDRPRATAENFLANFDDCAKSRGGFDDMTVAECYSHLRSLADATTNARLGGMGITEANMRLRSRCIFITPTGASR